MKKFSFPGQTDFYSGKVRDVYSIDDRLVVMIASDRLSAFDVVLPKPIPYKGQVLNQIAAYMLEACQDICPVWLLSTPAANVSVGKKCVPFKIEMVVRGYLSGHAWRIYSSGQRTLCGITMPEGLRENDKLPQPIITPSTKADEGHDEDISAENILDTGLATSAEWGLLSRYALQLFERGTALAAKRGLILVDTKYEFGKLDEVIVLIDEIHTPDSSRYFYTEGYGARQNNGEKQKQLSKEFVREWLISKGFQGQDGQTIPAMTDEWIDSVSRRYIELYETITGEQFLPADFTDEECFENIKNTLELLR